MTLPVYVCCASSATNQTGLLNLFDQRMPQNWEDVVISQHDLSSVRQLQQPIFSSKVLLLNIFFFYLLEFPDPSYLSCPIWGYTADGSCSHTLFCPTNKPSVSSPVLLWQMGPFSYTLRLSIKPWREREVVERVQGNVPMSLNLHEKAKRESSASVSVCYRQIEKEKSVWYVQTDHVELVNASIFEMDFTWGVQ